MLYFTIVSIFDVLFQIRNGKTYKKEKSIFISIFYSEYKKSKKIRVCAKTGEGGGDKQLIKLISQNKN